MPARATTHVFKVALQDERATYREIEVESRKSLAALAEGIVAAFDFDFDHAFGFYSKLTGRVTEAQPKYELFADVGEETDAGSVRKTRVETAFPNVGQTMLFLFDYGDDWRFVVEVTAIRDKTRGVRDPRILTAVGRSPEQYPSSDDDDED